MIALHCLVGHIGSTIWWAEKPSDEDFFVRMTRRALSSSATLVSVASKTLQLVSKTLTARPITIQEPVAANRPVRTMIDLLWYG
jgi:hypothetical protein